MKSKLSNKPVFTLVNHSYGKFNETENNIAKNIRRNPSLVFLNTKLNLTRKSYILFVTIVNKKIWGC